MIIIVVVALLHFFVVVFSRFQSLERIVKCAFVVSVYFSNKIFPISLYFLDAVLCVFAIDMFNNLTSEVIFGDFHGVFV